MINNFKQIWPDAPESTLIIDNWDSMCANCGRNCDPHEKQHLKNLGYNEEIRKQPGCGIEWTHVSTMYYGNSKTVKEMRPDLEYIDLIGEKEFANL